MFKVTVSIICQIFGSDMIWPKFIYIFHKVNTILCISRPKYKREAWTFFLLWIKMSLSNVWWYFGQIIFYMAQTCTGRTINWCKSRFREVIQSILKYPIYLSKSDPLKLPDLSVRIRSIKSTWFSPFNIYIISYIYMVLPDELDMLDTWYTR